MFALAKKVPSLATKGAFQNKRFYAYLGRPREQMSRVESWAHGLAIGGGILAVPVWVLTHINEYRGLDKKVAATED